MLVSTHLRDLAMQACEDALVLRGGSAVAAMAADELVGEAGAVPTEHSWTELRRGADDLRALLAFRSARPGPPQQGAAAPAPRVVLGLTVAAVVVPAYLRAPLHAQTSDQLVAILPSLLPRLPRARRPRRDRVGRRPRGGAP